MRIGEQRSRFSSRTQSQAAGCKAIPCMRPCRAGFGLRDRAWDSCSISAPERPASLPLPLCTPWGLSSAVSPCTCCPLTPRPIGGSERGLLAPTRGGLNPALSHSVPGCHRRQSRCSPPGRPLTAGPLLCSSPHRSWAGGHSAHFQVRSPKLREGQRPARTDPGISKESGTSPGLSTPRLAPNS